MSALRVPPAVIAPSLGLLRKLVFNPELSFARQRDRQEKLMRLMARLPRGTRADRTEVGGVPVLRVEAPGATADRQVVHLHGGAMCIGTSTMGRAFAAALSREARVVVLVVDFRRAPEHPYPAALDDTVAVCEAVLDGGAALALSADSAGASLAVGATQRLQRAGRSSPAALGLVCPLLVQEVHRAPYPADRMLSPEWLGACATAYLAGADPRDPLVSPLHADLAGLPPVQVHSATNDMLTEDAARFTVRARQAGVAVEHHEEKGLWHDYALQPGTLRAADAAVSRLARHLDGAWAAR